MRICSLSKFVLSGLVILLAASLYGCGSVNQAIKGSENLSQENGKISLQGAVLPPIFSTTQDYSRNAITITLKTNEPSICRIKYTTDLTDPMVSTTFKKYSGPITVDRSTVIRAIVRRDSDGAYSDPACGSYIIHLASNDGVAAPKITKNQGETVHIYDWSANDWGTISGGFVNGDYTANIINNQPGSTVYYTTDGTLPVLTSPKYTTPVTIKSPSNTAITARAYLNGKWSTTVISYFICADYLSKTDFLPKNPDPDYNYTEIATTEFFATLTPKDNTLYNIFWAWGDGRDGDMMGFNDVINGTMCRRLYSTPIKVTAADWRSGYVSFVAYVRYKKPVYGIFGKWVAVNYKKI